MSEGLSERLTREVGIMAGRLARLLETALPSATGAVAEGRAFLQAAYDAVSEGLPLSAWEHWEPPAGEPPHPFDRLVSALALSPAEIGEIGRAHV